MSSFAHIIEIIRNNYHKCPIEVKKLCSYMRVISYLVPAKIDETNVLSELLFSLSKVLEFSNEVVLGNYVLIIKGESKGLLTGWLNILECIEVFLELAAGHRYGEKGKWIVIACIQITKVIIRLLLLLEHKSGIQSTPLLLDQCTKLTEYESAWNEVCVDDNSKKAKSNYFKLESCGRVVRKLQSAPSLEDRTWSTDDLCSDNSLPNSELSILQTSAEAMNISRPLIHLISAYKYGLSSWKPWIFSVMMDTSSLLMMGNTKKLSRNEKAELKRRAFLLICYILRSPFYDKVAKLKLLFMLQLLSDEIPLVGFIFRPLKEYLLYWQKIYSYVWMT